MKRLSLLYIFFACSVQLTFTQVVSGDVEAYLVDIINDLPGADGYDYQVPTDVDLNTWNNMLDKLMTGDIEGARTIAGFMNYQIAEFADTQLKNNNHFFIVEEKKPQSKFWGTYVYSESPLRSQLVLQAPHPKYDSNTGFQAAFCFKRLVPRALFISGTHRCNHPSYSNCSGSTTACSESYAPYRVSDNAHNTQSVFQRATGHLCNFSDQTVFVQLHGFAKKSSDPYVIMSNGTRTTPAVDLISDLKNELKKADPVLTFKVAHHDTDWDRLLGFSNTQGRYINGSANACGQNATASDGRFIHIEQERTKLRKDSVGWHKMYTALSEVFKVDTVNSSVPGLSSSINLVFPNPANGTFKVKCDVNMPICIYNLMGTCVYRAVAGSELTNIQLPDVSPGIYLVKTSLYGKEACVKLMVK